MKWSFDTTNTTDGANNPLIKHFTGDSFYHLAREVLQNSNDARKDKSKPVKVEFSEFEIDVDRIPGIDQYKEAIESAEKFWPKHKKDEIDFIKTIKTTLKKKKIPFLKCSDSNTTGLTGTDKEISSPWCGLVRSKGNSTKGDGGGGSFGIGKGAPFTVSDLKMIFYYTCTGQGKFRFQGKTELVSHEVDSKTKSGTGFYGKEDSSSIEIFDEIPDVFRRNNIKEGLDIFIAGFRKDKDWADRLIVSVLKNFWYAIHEKELIVKVGTTVINKKNIPNLLSQYFSDNNKYDSVEPIGNPLAYYNTILHGEEIKFNTKHLGELKFYFKKAETLINRVAIMRKPHMVIMAKPFRFPGNFSGVLICDNDKGNEVLRQMEPPTHNRLEGENYGYGGKSILDELYDNLRKILKDKQNIKSSGRLEIPDLHKYLPSEIDDISNNSNSGDGTGKETNIETARSIQKKETFNSEIEIDPYQEAVVNKKTEGGSGGNKKGNSKKRKGKGKSGLGDKGKGPKVFSQEQIQIIPIVQGKSNNEYEYSLLLKSTEKIKFKLKIEAQGETVIDEVNISQAIQGGKNCQIDSNTIKDIEMNENDETVINLKLEYPFKTAFKFTCYEN